MIFCLHGALTTQKGLSIVCLFQLFRSSVSAIFSSQRVILGELEGPPVFRYTAQHQSCLSTIALINSHNISMVMPQ